MNPFLFKFVAYGAVLGIGIIGALAVHFRQRQYQRLSYEEKKCPMCFRHLPFVDEVQFPCTHSFCHFCAETVRNEQVTCPVCRTVVF